MIAQAGRLYSCEVEQGVIEDYRQGILLAEICKRWNLPNVKALYKVIGKEERRIHVVPPEVREAILSAGPLSVRVLAAKFGYSKTTIHRIRTSGFDKWSDEEKRDIDHDELETVTFVPHTWRCPDHGRVTMSPCPICAARGITQRPAEFMPAPNNERKFLTILTAQ